MTKYIFLTGGVVSSLGKGLAAASLGSVLMAHGFNVRLRKLDPYLNVDPGTMSPYQHGECYVTNDGAETDLDLGHYERFTGVEARKDDNITTGQIYMRVLRRERRGEYLGGTVQVIPHVTDEIKLFISHNTDDCDFVICEIGGTVGDIEGLPFLEAIRQFSNDYGKEHCLFMHVTLLPYVAAANELKTKPTQHSVKELLGVGIQPDILLCRSTHDIPQQELRKIALFCNIKPERVIPALDVKSIYEVPLTYHAHGFDSEVLDYFNIKPMKSVNLEQWENIASNINNPEDTIDIAIVGKYTDLPDAYKSLNEALIHGGIAHKVKVNVTWVESSLLTKDNVSLYLANKAGIIVPGGFGERGIDGKLHAIEYARHHRVPFIGICLGMQLAVIEYARNICGITDAHSTEFSQTATPIVGLLTEWVKDNMVETRHQHDDLGGTMRLGAYPCHIVKDSLAYSIYEQNIIHERHRHRYEVNMDYDSILRDNGMQFTGRSPDGVLPEIVEIPSHPFFIGVQFHPELKSRPFEPHPLFVSFINAALHHSRLV